MAYLNEDGLARYDGLIKNWTTFKSGTVDGIDPLLNWQKTDTASAVTFYPLPAAPLDPVVSFAFTETGPAEGTKGPGNPSTITGVSSITVTRCETVGVDSTDYTIDLGDTYYGGSVDLSAGTMTVTHVMNTITSTPYSTTSSGNVTIFAYKFSNQVQNITEANNSLVCSHFNVINGINPITDGCSISKIRLYFYSTTISTSEDFTNWLVSENQEGHPVTVTYKIETPYTVPLTPTQIYSLSQLDPYTPRINTIYSDQTSVQVGYPKSPLATSTELTNAIISLGGEI